MLKVYHGLKPKAEKWLATVIVGLLALLLSLPVVAAYEAHVINVQVNVADPLFTKRAIGPTQVPVGTYQEWVVTIRIHNLNDYAMQGIQVTDNFGANLNVEFLSKTHGDYQQSTNKPGNQQRIVWSGFSLQPDEVATLLVKVSTGLNSAGKQEYTSPGEYELNSGATLKWLDGDGKQQSVAAPSVHVAAVEQQ